MDPGGSESAHWFMIVLSSSAEEDYGTMSRLMYLLRQSDRIVLIVFLVACLIVSGIILIIEPIIGWPKALHEHIPAITLFLLSSFAIYYMKSEQVLADYAKWKELGIKAVYRSRSDSDQGEAYSRMLKTARSEIFVVGITLKDLPQLHGSLLVEKGKKGCSIKLLILSPEYWQNDNPILDPVAAAMATMGKLGNGLRPDFQIAIAHIRVLAMDMARAHSDFEVRFYRQAPTLSLTIVDGESSRAKMRVELTPHNRPGDEQFRPILDLRQSSGRDLLTQFYKSYLALWSHALSYLDVQGSRVRLDQALDNEISEMLDLGTDWLPDELKAAASEVRKISG